MSKAKNYVNLLAFASISMSQSYIYARTHDSRTRACIYESHTHCVLSHSYPSTLKIIVAQSLYSILFFNGPQTEHLRSISSTWLGRLRCLFFFYPLPRLTYQDGVYMTRLSSLLNLNHKQKEDRYVAFLLVLRFYRDTL